MRPRARLALADADAPVPHVVVFPPLLGQPRAEAHPVSRPRLVMSVRLLRLHGLKASTRLLLPSGRLTAPCCLSVVVVRHDAHHGREGVPAQVGEGGPHSLRAVASAGRGRHGRLHVLARLVEQAGGQGDHAALHAGTLNHAQAVGRERPLCCLPDAGEVGIGALEMRILGVLRGGAHLALREGEGGSEFVQFRGCGHGFSPLGSSGVRVAPSACFMSSAIKMARRSRMLSASQPAWFAMDWRSVRASSSGSTRRVTTASMAVMSVDSPRIMASRWHARHAARSVPWAQVVVMTRHAGGTSP
uniref:ERF family protein n=1 Tax=uncultured marine virus TaxID=186617 RepID=A0A0F7L6Y6_9VIRU|nr:ERF family protein [uncultured marine virus]